MRTRSRRLLSTGGHLRSLEDTGGHTVMRVRDRVASGSNPGPPTTLFNTNRPAQRVFSRSLGSRRGHGFPVDRLGRFPISTGALA